MDEAFLLITDLSRPYPPRQLAPAKQRVNYRLSRARHVAENASAILAATFQILQTNHWTESRSDTVDNTVKTTLNARWTNNMMRKDSSPASAATSGTVNRIPTSRLDQFRGRIFSTGFHYLNTLLKHTCKLAWSSTPNCRSICVRQKTFPWPWTLNPWPWKPDQLVLRLSEVFL